ncbi:MAG: hypothetical protein ACE5JD_09760 [Candidatus Methylomirabilia bacterium]
MRKVQGHTLYTLTDLGYRVALTFTKLYQRVLSPTLDTFDDTVREALAMSPHRLDRALARLNADLDALARTCGLHLAA